ncbi:22461_t:CDS:2, partial [Racocetra persica]
LYPDHYHTRDESKEVKQFQILAVYNSIGKLLYGETEADVGNEPIVIYERSPEYIHISPEDNEYAFTMSNKHRSESLEVKKAYQQTYKLYEIYSHLEYPNK